MVSANLPQHILVTEMTSLACTAAYLARPDHPAAVPSTW
jgi:hypothetical protein